MLRVSGRRGGARPGPVHACPSRWRRPGAPGGEGIARVIRRPRSSARGQLHFLLWQARVDNTKAREELGIEFMPWEAGIRETVRWMLETGRL